MTPLRFRQCIDAIGWSQRQIARELKIGETTARRMATGQAVIHPAVASWLEALAAAHTRITLPADWHRDPD